MIGSSVAYCKYIDAITLKRAIKVIQAAEIFSLNMQVYLCTFYRIKILLRVMFIHVKIDLLPPSTQKDEQECVIYIYAITLKRAIKVIQAAEIFSLNMQVYLCTFYRIKILLRVIFIHVKIDLLPPSTQKDEQECFLSIAILLLHNR